MDGGNKGREEKQAHSYKHKMGKGRMKTEDTRMKERNQGRERKKESKNEGNNKRKQ